MGHRTYPEITGAVSVNTGSTSGEPSGVRAIKDTETVNGATHNRSLYDLWRNADLLDFSDRKELAVPDYVERTSAGESQYNLTGRIYCGESGSDDTALRLMRYFRLTDKFNNPLAVDGDKVVVRAVHDPLGATPVGVKRTLVSGTTSVTYDRQTLTHADIAYDFSYCEPGDEIVLSGGTPNDGTYIVEEVLSAYSMTIRSTSGTEVAFSDGPFSTTILVRTNGYFTHRKELAETYDVRVYFSREIPAATVYRIHYHKSARVKDVSRLLVGGMKSWESHVKLHGLQQVYEGVLGQASPHRHGSLGNQLLQNTKGEIVVDRQSSTDGVFGAYVKEREGSASFSPGYVRELDLSNLGLGGLSLYPRDIISGLSIEAAVADKIVDKALQTSAASDLTTVAADVVGSGSLNFTTEGVTAGMTLRVLSDPTTFYRITQVAPGGDNARLRIFPTPPSWTNESFEIYSRVFENKTQPKLYPNKMIAVAYAALPSTAAGSTTAGSAIFEDLTTNFTTAGVKVGDLLYILSENMNATRRYEVQTVAPGANNNRLEMTEVFLETAASQSYKLLDPFFMEGKAFVTEDVRGAEISVSLLNGVSSAWSGDRDNISVQFYDVLSASDVSLETTTGEVLAKSGLHAVQSRHTDGLFDVLPDGISSLSLLRASDLASAKVFNQQSLFIPANLTKGLTTFASDDWVRIGDGADSYAETMGLQEGDVIVPLEGSERLTDLTVLEVCAAAVRVSPTPTYSSQSGYPLPFFVKRGSSLRATSEMYANRFRYSAKPKVSKMFPGLMAVAAATTTGQYLSGTFQGTSSPWEGQMPVPLSPGDVLRYVVVRIVFGGATVDPNSTNSLEVQVINTLTGSSTLTLLTPYMDGGGPGLLEPVTLVTNSRIVTVTGGGLTGVVEPGCFLMVDDGGTVRYFIIEAVLNDDELVLKDAHGLAGGAYNALITNGAAIGGALSSANWFVSYVPDAPYEVLEGDYLHLKMNDTLSGAIVGYEVFYKSGGIR